MLALDALEQRQPHLQPRQRPGFSVQQVIDVAREITGHPIPAEIQTRRAGDPAVLIADAAAARRDLGWRPQHADLRAIIESAWRWHQSHPRGYAD